MNDITPMTLRLFIVDDEAPARAWLTTLLSDIAPDCPHQLVGEADNAQAALDGIVRLKPDIVLLDVQMPGMSGLELAAHIAHISAPAVIFVTAYDEYALKAFEVHALDYLLKPVRAERLAEAIKRASGMRPNALRANMLHLPRKHLSVQERDRLLLVPIEDVLYLKAELKYVTVRTKTKEYVIEESLTMLEEEWSSAFVRVHRNALVARNALIGVERCTTAVEGQEAWQAIVRDVDERLPISRRQWVVVKGLVRYPG